MTALGRLSSILLAVALCAATAHGFQDAGDDDGHESLVVIKAGRVITMNGDDLEDATIVVRDGVIVAVGKNVDYPFGGKVIDASDMVVMPGMINPCSALGVPRGGAQGIRPNAKLSVDWATEPEVYEDARTAGYTNLGLLPPGRVIPGRAMVVHTWAEDPSGLIMKDTGPVTISFNDPGGDKPEVIKAFEAAKKEIEKVEKARAEWEKKQKQKAAEAAKKKQAPPKPKSKDGDDKGDKKDPKQTPPAKDPKGGNDKKDAGKAKPEKFVPPKMNPLYVPLVEMLQDKKKHAIVQMGASGFSAWGSSLLEGGIFLHWEQVLEKYGISAAYRFHNRVVPRNSPFSVIPETDADLVADRLGKRAALVAVHPLINHFAYTRNKYSLGLLLHEAGCGVVYIPERETWSFYGRMRDSLIQMVHFGFPREHILETVTKNPAKMLGVDDKLGSIQADRFANLVFLTGDPLAYDTKIAKVMIKGHVVPTRNRIQ